MPTFTPPPDQPLRTDAPASFISKAFAFIGWFTTMVSEFTAFAASLSLVSTTDTSTSSVAIGLGAKSFTVSTGKSFSPGMFLVIADNAAPSTNLMYGSITSYNSGTGALVVNVLSFLGSGTKSAWKISQSAAGGAGFGANSFTGTQTLASGAAINQSISTVASAATPNIWSGTSDNINYTGTVTATGFAAAPQAGVKRTLILAGAASFTAGANMLIDGVVSFNGVAGDQVEVTAITTTQFRLRPKLVSGNSVVERTATQSVRGAVILASSADAIAGTDPYKPITSATLFAGLNASGNAPIYACRAWVNWNGTGTVAIRGSGNVSSITDNGTGDYTVNFATAMPDANYCAVGSPGNATQSFNRTLTTYGHTAALVKVTGSVGGTGTGTDFDNMHVAVFR